VYVISFPVILLAWKLPRAIYRHRSAPLLLAIANFVASIFIDIKWNIASFVFWVISAVFVLTIHVSFIVWISVALLFVLLLSSYFRTLKYSFIPSRFVSLQRKLITAIAGSTFLDQSVRISDDLTSDDVESFSKSQLTTFTNNLGLGVLYSRVVFFWAYQLDQYCDSQLPTFFSAVSYVWLFIYTVLTFTLINVGLLHLQPTSFAYASQPSVVDMLHYSLASLALSGIPQVTPVGTLAQLAQIVEEFLGPILGITLVFNVLYRMKEKQQAGALKDISETIRNRGTALTKDLETNYKITVKEAIAKLQELRWSTWSVLAYFDSRLPPEEE